MSAMTMFVGFARGRRDACLVQRGDHLGDRQGAPGVEQYAYEHAAEGQPVDWDEPHRSH